MKRTAINDGWRFRFGATTLSGADEWRAVELPHDYLIEQPRCADSEGGRSNGYFPGGVGEYAREFDAPDAARVWLMVDGAYMNAEVFLNGDPLGMHPYGYTAFLTDLTPSLVRGGTNRLSIQTQTRMPSTRWYSGGGLYREVALWTGPEQCLSPWDVYARCTGADERTATLCVDARVTGEPWGEISAELIDGDGTRAASAVAQMHTDNRLWMQVDHPRLWSVDDPALYTLRITLAGGDVHEQRVGLRTIAIDAKNGLRLNGAPMKLIGGCIHHDNGPIGAVSLPDAERRRLRRMKAVGYNAIRSAHHPASQALLDACDEVGILVMNEAFDCWNEGKNPQDYHLWFRDWWERDVEAMVRSGRNHPCVFSYSIGNEIPERDGHGDGAAWARRLADKARALDPDRPVTSALNNLNRPAPDPAPWRPSFGRKGYDGLRSFDPSDDYWGEKSEPLCRALDFVGYNYLQQRYAHDRVRFPDRPICGTETFPVLSWDVWKAMRENPNVIGDFVWTSWDYLGEAGLGRTIYEDEADWSGEAAYPYHLADDADFDICGDRTGQSYYREILWGLRKKPHLRTNHPSLTGRSYGGYGWHWNDSRPCWSFGDEWLGRPVTAEVYADADEVEFILNGQSLGRAGVERNIATMDIPYAPGRLEAVARRDGAEIGRDALETTGPAVRIVLEPEQTAMAADGLGLCYIGVRLADEQGRTVSTGDRRLNVAVDGAARLAGLGSADPRSEESYCGPERTTYEGRLLIVLRASNQPGEVRVRVGAADLPEATVTVRAE